jgi:hypothetical protein
MAPYGDGMKWIIQAANTEPRRTALPPIAKFGNARSIKLGACSLRICDNIVTSGRDTYDFLINTHSVFLILSLANSFLRC